LEWDEAKSEKNRAEREFGFEIADSFEWSSAVVERDDRKDYGEARYRAFGRAADLRLCIAFTLRGEVTRIISVRRMHDKEAAKYGF
jgi:uncharacterized DUF497 family protein